MVKVNNVLLNLVALVSVGASGPSYPGDSTHLLATNGPVEPGLVDLLSPKNILNPTANAAPADIKSPPPESSTPIDEAPVNIKDPSHESSRPINVAPLDTNDPSPESSSSIDAAPEGSGVTEKDIESTPKIKAHVNDFNTLEDQSSELIQDNSGENDYLSAIGDIVKDNAVAISAATLTAAFATWFFTPSEE
ncbi:hypothetical protein CONCODRAFT_72347 [Conidiobolus coronatus NRRL 28638]|uniref:Uncharacterized protein n=1 Tax=Conidiobolus coronatus (strain ATCC 28846 / CBS 209.66 / NRRL 28638) TaxID=796925 RepID=A0A137NZX3_CONC2|nr:hypothetical protein CONCODRAFT_72347 [Conidiobolus coronatus NRRL 28638]|eukprot:KXN68282.1 hypothetical protein CONCODRAFT_72347 [Conidiobolus coronatus NRRL 28638]